MSASSYAFASRQPAWYSRAVPWIYLLLVCVCTAAGFVYKLRYDGVFACPASGYGADAFLSDCTARSFGDYDHGAFWFDLEPPTLSAATGADVLFVGNSRLQFALSTPQRERWFAALGIKEYLLGFSHSETVAYISPLLAKLQPRAKAYVLNVDRLFDDRVSPPAAQIFGDRDAHRRYQEKRTWQSLHRHACAAAPALCGDSMAVYRVRDTGAWRRTGTAAFSGQTTSAGAPSNVDRWDRYASLAEQFVDRLPVERRCVILTLVPTAQGKRAEAEAIASRLAMPLTAPELPGLHTFDGSHLDVASAERWSQALLDAAGPQIRRCVAEAGGR